MQVTIEDVQAQRGSTAEFQAVIEGDPQPTVIWYKVEMHVGWGACIWGKSVKSPLDITCHSQKAGWAPVLGPRGVG